MKTPFSPGSILVWSGALLMALLGSVWLGWQSAQPGEKSSSLAEERVKPKRPPLANSVPTTAWGGLPTPTSSEDLNAVLKLPVADVDEWSSEKNSAFLKDWFRKHWPAAKSLLDQLPEGRRYQAYLFAANAIWETQPDLAMQFAADVFANKNDPEGHVLEGLLSQEIERVGSDNLAQWLLQAVPTSSTRDSVLGRVFRDWGQKDPAAAEKWIAARENQTGADINQLDTPKYTLCSVVAPKDPAKAIWLAQGINNEHLQQSALISFVGRWLDGDIKQGLTALHAAGFQPDEIQSLLQMAKDRDND